MSTQRQRVETLFLHGTGDDYLVVPIRDGKRLFQAVLELKETDAGPRPGKFRIKRDSTQEPRNPAEFVEFARGASRIRISEQTSKANRTALRELLAGYQLDARVVRTCRHCASAGRYSPITGKTAIETGREQICPDCAFRELERELSYAGGITGTAEDRLKELLLEVQDLERITNLLSGNLDPDLTKFDEISATTEDIDPVPTSSLDLHPKLQTLLEGRFDELLPVQSLAVENGLFGDAKARCAGAASSTEHSSAASQTAEPPDDGHGPRVKGEDQLVVSATATGKPLVGEMAGIDRVLEGEGKLLFLVPLVALANQ